ncbi:MAG: extracellular solute-binding protein, partial [Okeania sp. SIO2D1]|nr:extracellular solute-binding protein [Okeania sp. SIO2D1]
MKHTKFFNFTLEKLIPKINAWLKLIIIRLKKQLQITILIVATFLGILYSSISPALTQEKPVTIQVLMSATTATQLEPIQTDFNKTHPNIKLEIVKAPNDTNLVEDLYTSSFLLGDSPYDLAYMDTVWVPKFAAANWLQDLSEKIDKQQLKETYVSGDIEGG